MSLSSRCRPRPSSSICLVSGRRSSMCSLPNLLPLRFRERKDFGNVGRRVVISLLDSISQCLTSMARLR